MLTVQGWSSRGEARDSRGELGDPPSDCVWGGPRAGEKTEAGMRGRAVRESPGAWKAPCRSTILPSLVWCEWSNQGPLYILIPTEVLIWVLETS